MKKSAKEKIVIVGGGGHARVIIDTLCANQQFEIVGIVDAELPSTAHILGFPVIGNDDSLPLLFSQGIHHAALGIGGLYDLQKRAHMFTTLTKAGFLLPAIIHPAAYVSSSARIEEGTHIMAGAVVQANAHIKTNSIVNTHASVDHDCTVGPHAHVAPGAVIVGGAKIEESAFVGAGAVVIQNITIGAHALVGAGAVVVRDVAPHARVMGVPAKEK